MNYAGPWTCPLCSQTISWPEGKALLPPGYFDTCKLKDHMIGIECVAYRDYPKAKALLATKHPASQR